MQDLLKITLKLINDQQVELRYKYESEPGYTSLIRSLNTIEELIEDTEGTYNTVYQGRLDRLGKALYQWLDGEGDRVLTRTLHEARYKLKSQYLVLAIDTEERLAHLPWELLHDGTRYLVESSKPNIVPIRWNDKGSFADTEVAPRPLRVLFMATAPLNIEPVLEFEDEEALILTSTKKQKLNLIVEESGNLEELSFLVSQYGEMNRFDVFHLTGHAFLSPEGPRFYTETEIGAAHEATPEELWSSLPFPPRILFLSGCHTGAMGDRGAVASLAHQLLDLGATTVLGWGRKVRDDLATQAAGVIYDKLALGHGLAMALSKTYQHLIAQKHEDWHLLRLFVSGRMPGALVTEPLRPGRRDPFFPGAGTTFLNEREKRGEVADYKSFVGRRRELQLFIKILKRQEYAGILLWGMGGAGKSSLANRIISRLKSTYKVIVITDRSYNTLDIDRARSIIGNEIQEQELRNKLCFVQPEGGIRKYSGSIDPATFSCTLCDVLRQTTDRLLFLIDDFEGNFEKNTDRSIQLSDDQKPRITVNALSALSALIHAIRETQEDRDDGGHQLIITSRYPLVCSDANYLYQRQITRLGQADVDKKLQRLESNQRPLQPEVRTQIVKFADGNPRLLEWLFKLGTEQKLHLSEYFEAEQERFKKDIFVQHILEHFPADLLKLLGRLVIFELPVPSHIVEKMCQDLSLDTRLAYDSSLGLLEKISSPSGDEDYYSVSQVIAAELPKPDAGILQQAADLICAAWVRDSTSNSPYSPIREAQTREVYRLAKQVKASGPLIASARVLCETWCSLGKNYCEIISLCQDVLAQENDYKILCYLGNALFESGARYHQNGEELDGFEVINNALETCPAENIQARSELLTIGSYWFKDYGNHGKALALAQEAESLSEKTGNLSTRVAALHSLAVILCEYGDFEKGENIFQKAEKLSRNLPPAESLTAQIIRTDAEMALFLRDFDRRRVVENLIHSSDEFDRGGALLHYAMTTNLLSWIHLQYGAYEKAADLCDQAMKNFRLAGSIRGEAYNLILSAAINAARDSAGPSIEGYERAIELGKKLRHNGILFRAHAGLGELRLERQEYDQAEFHFNNAQSFCRQAENLFGIAYTTQLTTRLAIARNEDIPEAIDRCGEMLSRLQDCHAPLHGINMLNQMGDAYKQLQKYDEAHRAYKQAMEVKAHANYPGFSYAQYQLGQLYEIQEKWEDALNYYRASLAIYKENESGSEQAGALEAMANIYFLQNKYEEVIDHMNRALNIRSEMGTLDSLIQSWLNKLRLLDKMDRLQSLPSEMEALESKLDLLKEDYFKALCFDEIAIYRSRTGFSEIALSHWRQAYRILAKFHAWHLVTAFAQHKVAYGLLKHGCDTESAIQCLRAAHAVMRTRLGGQHEVVRAIMETQADLKTASPVFEKWSLMPLTQIDKQIFPDKSAEVLSMFVGLDIVSVFDPDEGSRILDRIGEMRAAMLDQDYFLLPNIRIRDSTNIPSHDYVMSVNEKEIFRGELPARYAIPSPTNKKPFLFERNVTQESGFPFPLRWIDDEIQVQSGARIFKAEDVVIENLIKVIGEKRGQILDAIQ